MRSCAPKSRTARSTRSRSDRSGGTQPILTGIVRWRWRAPESVRSRSSVLESGFEPVRSLRCSLLRDSMARARPTCLCGLPQFPGPKTKVLSVHPSPIAKRASLRATLVRELRHQGHEQLIDLVWLWFCSSARWLVARLKAGANFLNRHTRWRRRAAAFRHMNFQNNVAFRIQLAIRQDDFHPFGSRAQCTQRERSESGRSLFLQQSPVATKPLGAAMPTLGCSSRPPSRASPKSVVRGQSCACRTVQIRGRKCDDNRHERPHWRLAVR